MATFSTNHTTSGLRTAFANIGSSIARAFSAYVDSRARTEQIERLQSKSDAELARIGITRADIPRYVFRDLICY